VLRGRWSQWAHRRAARSDGRRPAWQSRSRPPAPYAAGRQHRAGWPGWARPERWSRRARLAAAQRRFLEDTSHQLRAPITIALGHAELLAGQLSGNQGRRDIDVVVGELERLRRLSDRLLLIVASENPDFLRPEPVELDMLAANRLLRWRAAAPRHWTAGRLDPAVADADPERLGLALDALIENAVQHTADGGAITVSVTADPAGRMAAVSVSDTGEGIQAKDLSRIFERFATSGGGTQGTGLGLALVRAIARGHGGEIRVRSAPGEGSQFDLVLPIRPGAAAGRIEWGTGDNDDA
jgi:signal transduction histidine kinase